jgi:hypothetical protein
VPHLQSLSLRRHPRKNSQSALNGNLQSLLEDISFDTPAKKLVGSNLRSVSESILELEKADSIINKENEIQLVETDLDKLVEESIFDLVIKMERQFDDLFEDVEEIKKAKTGKKIC